MQGQARREPTTRRAIQAKPAKGAPENGLRLERVMTHTLYFAVETASASGTIDVPAPGNRTCHEPSALLAVNTVPILGTPGDDVLGGTPLDDVILGLAGDDILDGGAGNDAVMGGAGNDTLLASPGNDLYGAVGPEHGVDFELEPGIDRLVYAGERNAYAIESGISVAMVGSPKIILIDKPGDERDTVVTSWLSGFAANESAIGIERIEFDDGALIYDLGGPNVGFGYRIYHASFDRTPDEGGVRFWVGVLDQVDDRGWSVTEKEQFLARQFVRSDEFRDLYGSNPTHEQYIDAMYGNVLDRLPDQEGRDFWLGGMEQGLTQEDVLIAFTNSKENLALTAPDLYDGVWVV